MTDLAATDDLFFTRAGLDRGRVQGIVEDALKGTDDGELFLEYRQSENIVFDDGQIKSAAFDTSAELIVGRPVNEQFGIVCDYEPNRSPDL